MHARKLALGSGLIEPNAAAGTLALKLRSGNRAMLRAKDNVAALVEGWIEEIGKLLLDLETKFIVSFALSDNFSCSLSRVFFYYTMVA